MSKFTRMHRIVACLLSFALLLQQVNSGLQLPFLKRVARYKFPRSRSLVALLPSQMKQPPDPNAKSVSLSNLFQFPERRTQSLLAENDMLTLVDSGTIKGPSSGGGSSAGGSSGYEAGASGSSSGSSSVSSSCKSPAAKEPLPSSPIPLFCVFALASYGDDDVFMDNPPPGSDEVFMPEPPKGVSPRPRGKPDEQQTRSPMLRTKRIEGFWKKHGGKIMVGAALVVGIAVAVGAYFLFSEFISRKTANATEDGMKRVNFLQKPANQYAEGRLATGREEPVVEEITWQFQLEDEVRKILGWNLDIFVVRAEMANPIVSKVDNDEFLQAKEVLTKPEDYEV